MEIYDSAHRPLPIIEELQALLRYKDLVQQFIARSIKTRYKRSVLGVFWTMLNPLLTMLVLTLVFSNFFRFQIENFPIYVLCGLMAWNFFSSTTRETMGEMVWSGNLLRRIYVPKSIFAISAVGSGLVNLGLSLVPLLLIAAFVGAPLGPALLVLPFSIALLAAFCLGLGLILATAAVFFADVLPVYDVLLTIWVYATPVFYPLDIIPEHFSWVFRLNPMYYLLELFRQPVYLGVVPDAQTWLIGGAISLLTLLVGAFFFTSKSNEYAYRT